ncbi:MAG: hypothetical protein V3W34_20740 [Phycisphaerae bacterium]
MVTTVESPNTTVQEAERDTDRTVSAREVNSPVQRPLENPESLAEGETRLCMMGPGGAPFETDFHRPEGHERVFTVLWHNVDATGFMDAAKGDRIISIG